MKSTEIGALPGCRPAPIHEGQPGPTFPDKDASEKSVMLPGFLNVLRSTLGLESALPEHRWPPEGAVAI